MLDTQSYFENYFDKVADQHINELYEHANIHTVLLHSPLK